MTNNTQRLYISQTVSVNCQQTDKSIKKSHLRGEPDNDPYFGLMISNMLTSV